MWPSCRLRSSLNLEQWKQYSVLQGVLWSAAGQHCLHALPDLAQLLPLELLIHSGSSRVTFQQCSQQQCDAGWPQKPTV